MLRQTTGESTKEHEASSHRVFPIPSDSMDIGLLRAPTEIPLVVPADLAQLQIQPDLFWKRFASGELRTRQWESMQELEKEESETLELTALQSAQGTELHRLATRTIGFRNEGFTNIQVALDDASKRILAAQEFLDDDLLLLSDGLSKLTERPSAPGRLHTFLVGNIHERTDDGLKEELELSKQIRTLKSWSSTHEHLEGQALKELLSVSHKDIPGLTREAWYLLDVLEGRQSLADRDDALGGLRVVGALLSQNGALDPDSSKSVETLRKVIADHLRQQETSSSKSGRSNQRTGAKGQAQRASPDGAQKNAKEDSNERDSSSKQSQVGLSLGGSGGSSDPLEIMRALWHAAREVAKKALRAISGR